MNRGRKLGLALVLSSGLTVGMFATAPTAFAADAPAGSALQASTDLHQTAFRADPPRGDYAQGYDDGRQKGVPDGEHDAHVDCKKQNNMKAHSANGNPEYQRGWEAGYNAGYEFGYNQVYQNECKANGVKKSASIDKSDSGKQTGGSKTDSKKDDSSKKPDAGKTSEDGKSDGGHNKADSGRSDSGHK